ncbi:hypothetical protein GCM10011386_38940 [Parapedobacter defluvii]|uniref:Tail specific protease domain-containing protein n=1 Tax=Parapedobacter defluvii TaxID=2045106 RepID=A0ABQ1MLX1_9SPHI|nr:S41 family peptidase [Parapedobacter defluvii]GGC42878.1 hypothetical protein GCM10011386_38940 [Parapedobacter defluvii]
MGSTDWAGGTPSENTAADTSASNEDGMYRNIARHLLSTNAPILKLKIDRNGQAKFIESPTYPNGTIVTQPSGNDSVFRQLSNTIGYVNHGLLKKSDLPLLREQINGCKGLIIDMRTPPKATIGLGFAHYLLDTGKPFIKFTHSSLSEAGTFRYTPNSLVGLENSEYFRGPVVILVNESTQSSAEFYTMAYQQAPYAWTIGSQTAGADGNIAMIQLPFDYKVLISSLGIYYPDGSETQQVGIRIDQEVRPTLKGIREGRDEQLEKAVEYINKSEFSKPTQLSKNDRLYKFIIPFVIICFGIIAKYSRRNYGRKRLRKY